MIFSRNISHRRLSPHFGDGLFLSVAKVMVYLRVAGLAQAHEVLSCVSAALGNGQNVVYFLHRSQPTFLEALFTQRMLCGITVADTLPRSAVFAVDIGTAFVYMDKCGYDFVIMVKGMKALVNDAVKEVRGTFEDSRQYTIRRFS